MGYGAQLCDIAKKLIAIAFLTGFVDHIIRYAQCMLKRSSIPWNEFDDIVSYTLLWGFASAICWQGRFDLFCSLCFNWHYAWEGYLATGGIIAAGTKFLLERWKVMGGMPGFITGFTSYFGGGSNTNLSSFEDEKVTTKPPAATPTTPVTTPVTTTPNGPDSNLAGDL